MRLWHLVVFNKRIFDDDDDDDHKWKEARDVVRVERTKVVVEAGEDLCDERDADDAREAVDLWHAATVGEAVTWNVHTSAALCVVLVT